MITSGARSASGRSSASSPLTTTASTTDRTTSVAFAEGPSLTKLQVTFLGTAGTMPTPERNVSAIALRFGDELLLFDCGEGTQRQLMRSPHSFMAIRRIFISHLHGDHYLGLAGMFLSMRMNERTAPLDLYIGPRGSGRIEELLGADRVDYGFPVAIHEVEPGTALPFDGYTMRCVRTDHTTFCHAWAFEEDARPGRFDRPKAIALGVPVGPLFGRLQRGEAVEAGGGTVRPEQVLGPPRRGRKFVFSGDTRPCTAVAELSQGADVLVHEATFDTASEDLGNTYGHSSARQAGAIGAQAQVGRLF